MKPFSFVHRIRLLKHYLDGYKEEGYISKNPSEYNNISVLKVLEIDLSFPECFACGKAYHKIEKIKGKQKRIYANPANMDVPNVQVLE